VRETLGLKTLVRKDFLEYHGRGEDLANRVARTKARYVAKAWESFDPVYGEVQFEKRLLRDPGKRAPGVLYDGHQMMRLFADLLPPKERTLRTAHVAFTSRLFGTWEADGRYHARVVVAGYPILLSDTGIVEGPAKPKEYYLLKRKSLDASGSIPYEAIKQPFAGRFVDYDDPRLTEVMKGYVLQGLFHHLTGEAFCDDASCLLYDAHWQSEVLAAQLESGRLCTRHAGIAKTVRYADLPTS
jgi:hypothetical protein